MDIAELVKIVPLCLRRQVGALIVKDKRILEAADIMVLQGCVATKRMPADELFHPGKV